MVTTWNTWKIDTLSDLGNERVFPKGDSYTYTSCNIGHSVNLFIYTLTPSLVILKTKGPLKIPWNKNDLLPSPRFLVSPRHSRPGLYFIRPKNRTEKITDLNYYQSPWTPILLSREERNPRFRETWGKKLHVLNHVFTRTYLKRSDTDANDPEFWVSGY